jgi:hypothetical protein
MITKDTTFQRKRIIALLIATLLLLSCVISTTSARQKYRTFNQNELSFKKTKVKVTTTQKNFTFRNDVLGIPVSGLYLDLNAEVISVQDSGGFSMLMFGPKRKNIHLTGRTVEPGDSVVLSFAFDKKGSRQRVNFWQWDTGGVIVGDLYEQLQGVIQDQSFSNPNGGTVRDYLYKKVITRPNGLVIGIPRIDSAKNYGWIRFKASDKKYFPHTGTARCFDYIVNGNGSTKRFVRELKNPHVNKHDNHLLGELHTLKLAIIANEAGVTDPDTGTSFGDLLYNDSTNSLDPCNGESISEIAHLADSALTYCNNFVSTFYLTLDSCITRINRAFDGPYVAYARLPLRIRGTQDLSEVPFLHPNAVATNTFNRRSSLSSIIEDVPQRSLLMQNYPNPFNPTTTINFHLAVPSIVTLKVYNMIGQEVATLLDQEELGEGDQSADFNAGQLSSGVYFYNIVIQSTDEDVPQYVQSVKRMLLLK